MERVTTAKTSSLISALAEELKKSETISPPTWAALVKTSHGKERIPQQADWWHIRAAAMLRKVALTGPIGTEKLRTLYGTKKNRGYKPERFVKASGAITRKILQQLEAEGLIAQDQRGSRKGRIITPKGISLLQTIAKKA